MILFRKKPRARITVELKIIGFFLGEYVNVVAKLAMDEGCSPSRMLREAREEGLISPALHAHLRRHRRAFSFQRNGELLPPGSYRRARLAAGDSLLVFSALSGG